MRTDILSIVEDYQADSTRLIDMLWDIQNQYGFIPPEAIDSLSNALNMSVDDINETLSFYHFFRAEFSGKHKIYLAESAIAKIQNYQEIRDVLIHETGCQFGKVDKTGTFGLFDANCIGLSDQEPAMMVDDVVFTHLTAEKVTRIIQQLRDGKSAADIANPDYYASTTIEYIQSMITDNLRKTGPVFFKPDRDYQALLSQCLQQAGMNIIETLTLSNIRGRGGAGFPTGLKWRLCREAEGKEKYIICNADEGEPGTFKDRALLTHSPKDVLAGMIMAAYAIGSRHGIIYLRSEYLYLKAYLQAQIDDFYQQKLLGKQILGHDFDFDIRIQLGAGAYVCGDETALIESCEGKRGTPRVKPPYPIQQGYLGMPTAVNNVETFAAVSRIIEEGAEWFKGMGTDESSGTRLLSVSGDCEAPGIYEIEWGITLNEVLDMVGAAHPMAIQISGPSGECVSARQDGNRIFCYSDLSCNGSLMIFNHKRDLLQIVKEFMRFFVEESCGICVPCRAGNVDLLDMVERVITGKVGQDDLEKVISWGTLVRSTSRCGLGTTSPKPILTTLDKFPEIYQQKVSRIETSLLPGFDLESALQDHKQAYHNLQKERIK